MLNNTLFLFFIFLKKKKKKTSKFSLCSQLFTDTALELLTWDFSLRDLRDEHGTTCFQLLANMPSAFKSGHPVSVLEGLLYLCMPHKICYQLEKFITFLTRYIIAN